MKTLVLLLVASALANAGMLAFIAVRSPATAAASPAADVRSPTDSRAAGGTGNASVPTHAERSLEDVWASPTTEELPGIVARLRAAGYPPGVIRSIVASMVSNLFADRRRAIEGTPDETEFWKGSDRPFGVLPPISSEVRIARRQLDLERTALLKALLGPDANDPTSPIALLNERMLGPLAPEKLEQVQAIRADYADLRQSILATPGLVGGARLPADSEKLALLAKEETADLLSVLTPEEHFELQVRSSDTATMLRNQLTAFNPTEDEFRAIVRAQLALGGSPAPLTGVVTSADMQRQQQALISALTNVLPSDRLEDLRIASDPNLQVVARILSRFGLPLQSATEVATIQRETQQRAAAVRGRAAADPAQAAQQMAALSREANDRLQKLLGDRALAGYREYGGQWLQALQMPVRPPATRSPATP